MCVCVINTFFDRESVQKYPRVGLGTPNIEVKSMVDFLEKILKYVIRNHSVC